MEQADLQKRIEALETAVKNLLGPNPYIDEWVKHIRASDTKVQEIEKRVADLERAANGPTIVGPRYAR